MFLLVALFVGNKMCNISGGGIGRAEAANEFYDKDRLVA
jgi:hypothetical protein